LDPGLAKAALAARVDGKLAHTSALIDHDRRVVTIRTPNGLEIIRHSTAHLLATCRTEELFKTQVTMARSSRRLFYAICYNGRVFFSSEEL